MNPLSDHAGPVVISFYYPDYTVGLGITPSHALARSWALPPIGNSLRAVSPCPEG
jgi:hypothetical protein